MKKSNTESSYDMLRRYAKGNSPYVKLVKEQLKTAYSYRLGAYKKKGEISDYGALMALELAVDFLCYNDLLEEFRQAREAARGEVFED